MACSMTNPSGTGESICKRTSVLNHVVPNSKTSGGVPFLYDRISSVQALANVSSLHSICSDGLLARKRSSWCCRKSTVCEPLYEFTIQTSIVFGNWKPPKERQSIRIWNIHSTIIPDPLRISWGVPGIKRPFRNKDYVTCHFLNFFLISAALSRESCIMASEGW